MGSLPPDSSMGVVFSLPGSGSEMQFKNQEDSSFSSGSPECSPSPAVRGQLCPARSAWIHRGDGREEAIREAVPASHKDS